MTQQVRESLDGRVGVGDELFDQLRAGSRSAAEATEMKPHLVAKHGPQFLGRPDGAVFGIKGDKLREYLSGRVGRLIWFHDEAQRNFPKDPDS